MADELEVDKEFEQVSRPISPQQSTHSNPKSKPLSPQQSIHSNPKTKPLSPQQSLYSNPKTKPLSPQQSLHSNPKTKPLSPQQSSQPNPEPEEVSGTKPNISDEISKQNQLSTEFVYYSSILKILGPSISLEHKRNVIREWIKKLFKPEYNSAQLKEKRNRYLASLTISILLDELIGMFQDNPPSGVLPELNISQPLAITAAEWELDKMWQKTLQSLPVNFKSLECSVHTNYHDCESDHRLDKILDQEFQLLLYIVRPYAALLTKTQEKMHIATWLQILCSIYGEEHCSSMKAIRNDYLMLLLGYLNDLRAVGPFQDYPSWKTLEPLVIFAKKNGESIPITDPTGPEVNDFLLNQPVPDDGAFCYIALTGDLISSAFSKP